MQNRLDLNLVFGPVPPFTQVLADMDDLSALLYECIEAGSARGLQVATEEQSDANESLDPWLVAMVLRGRARKLLKKRGVESTEDGPLNMSSQPLIGLLFHYKGYSFRILKETDGGAPGCGSSGARRRFYDQSPTKYMMRSGKLAISKLNLLVLYSVDKDGVSRLRLACTSIGAKFAHEVAYHWNERLPYPGEATGVPTPPITPSTPPDPDPLAGIVQLPDQLKAGRKA
jgi:hypothetical protein